MPWRFCFGGYYNTFTASVPFNRKCTPLNLYSTRIYPRIACVFSKIFLFSALGHPVFCGSGVEQIIPRKAQRRREGAKGREGERA